MEEEEIASFIESIEDLYKLHYITQNYDHFIQLGSGEWRLFEPSKFIYSYFAFNSYYNIDWEKSIKINQLTGFDKIITYDKDCKKNKEKEPSEGQKYKVLIDFILSRIDDSDKEEFFNIIRSTNQTNILLEAISKITPDNRISESESADFINEFQKLLLNEEISVGKFKKIIRFIYLVRNNIFHGTKTTIVMSENFQKKRLEIYTNILIATNEMLFRVLEKYTKFIRKSYKIK